MKLWLISQSVQRGYDTYDSAVVTAETAEQAQATLPSEYATWDGGEWARKPEQVMAEELGEAKSGTRPGKVICASFNAG